MRLYLPAVLAIGLAACSAGAPTIDEAHLSEVRKGETTLAEVVSRFGRPSIVSRNIDGTQTAAYVLGDREPSVAAVVPLVAALAGKPDANVDSVILSFDSAGVLSDYLTTRARPREAASHRVDVPATVRADIPTRAGKTSARVSDPWDIRLEASGQKENR